LAGENDQGPNFIFSNIHLGNHELLVFLRILMNNECSRHCRCTQYVTFIAAFQFTHKEREIERRWRRRMEEKEMGIKID
jgi:hypothetical protein